jgi:hypothetical protein
MLRNNLQSTQEPKEIVFEAEEDLFSAPKMQIVMLSH